jgi:hypothetical protein
MAGHIKKSLYDFKARMVGGIARLFGRTIANCMFLTLV